MTSINCFDKKSRRLMAGSVAQGRICCGVRLNGILRTAALPVNRKWFYEKELSQIAKLRSQTQEAPTSLPDSHCWPPNEVMPEFYSRDERGISRPWVDRMRASMAGLTPRFC